MKHAWQLRWQLYHSAARHAEKQRRAFCADVVALRAAAAQLNAVDDVLPFTQVQQHLCSEGHSPQLCTDEDARQARPTGVAQRSSTAQRRATALGHTCTLLCKLVLAPTNLQALRNARSLAVASAMAPACV
jgi:hypothetical protein